MKILLTNADGVDADGINAMEKVLSRAHQVYVVAPHRNNSGVSSSISIYRELLLHKISDRKYALEGTPVDCVISGVLGGYLPHIDLVVSGINKGPNLGTEVVYSGPCAAARRAALCGIPGLSFSVDNSVGVSENYHYESLAEFALRNLERLIVLCGPLNRRKLYNDYEFFVNVNAPAMEKYSGAEIVPCCLRRYPDQVSIKSCGENLFSSTCTGGSIIESAGKEYADQDAVKNGKISVSAVRAEPSSKNAVTVENFFIL